MLSWKGSLKQSNRGSSNRLFLHIGNSGSPIAVYVMRRESSTSTFRVQPSSLCLDAPEASTQLKGCASNMVVISRGTKKCSALC